MSTKNKFPSEAFNETMKDLAPFKEQILQAVTNQLSYSYRTHPYCKVILLRKLIPISLNTVQGHQYVTSHIETLTNSLNTHNFNTQHTFAIKDSDGVKYAEILLTGNHEAIENIRTFIPHFSFSCLIVRGNEKQCEEAFSHGGLLATTDKCSILSMSTSIQTQHLQTIKNEVAS